jgi:hypothetical protein
MRYQPGTISASSLEELRRGVNDELRRIADALSLVETQAVNLEALHVAPGKPRHPAIAYSAAGVLGVNEGLYRYDSANTWVFIG